MICDELREDDVSQDAFDLFVSSLTTTQKRDPQLKLRMRAYVSPVGSASSC